MNNCYIQFIDIKELKKRVLKIFLWAIKNYTTTSTLYSTTISSAAAVAILLPQLLELILIRFLYIHNSYCFLLIMLLSLLKILLRAPFLTMRSLSQLPLLLLPLTSTTTTIVLTLLRLRFYFVNHRSCLSTALSTQMHPNNTYFTF